MLLDLYIYPHPVLSRVADPVDAFDEALSKLVADMTETMYEGCGVGLAAPQVGVSRQIFIVDSLGASSGYGLFMDQLADLRDAGYSLGELYEWAMSNRKKLNHWFFSTDLTYYVRGGRISRAAGSIGNALDICPLMNMDYAGHLVPRYKIRTKKRVIRAIVDQMENCARAHTEYDGKCYLSHSNCLQDARAVADLVEERFPRLDGKVEIYDVGTTIGSHTGPGTVALFFWGQERMD